MGSLQAPTQQMVFFWGGVRLMKILYEMRGLFSCLEWSRKGLVRNPCSLAATKVYRATKI